MSTRVLIVYGSNYGQTAKVAARIAEILEQDGIAVTLRKGDAASQRIDANYDGIMVGASMVVGKYQKYIRSFVLRNRGALQGVPSAFFAVSGSAGGTPAERKAAQDTINEFLRQTGWTPSCVASIAGAIAYTKYNPFVRWMMKRMMASAGRPSDTSRDYEFTDWQQVADFTAAFNKLIGNQSLLATGSGHR